MLCFESKLTKREEEARDIMVYLFNPVLKFLLMSSNPSEFIKYGCNSCRQTAILGAGYLRKLLPDYDFYVYEGSFVEKINGNIVPYTHAFISAVKGNRHLVIDLSRTTKRLLFQETDSSAMYPEIEDYDEVYKIGQVMLNLDELLNTDAPEYFTGWKPQILMGVIDEMINTLMKLPKKEQLQFCDRIYLETTSLRR